MYVYNKSETYKCVRDKHWRDILEGYVSELVS